MTEGSGRTIWTEWACRFCAEGRERYGGYDILHGMEIPKGWSLISGMACCDRHKVVVLPPEARVEGMSR